mgnify:CR=1 FL=1
MSEVLLQDRGVKCPHGSPGQLGAPSQRVVKSQGAFVLVQGDQHVVSGCLFTVAGTPSPCIVIGQVATANKVRIGGKAVLLRTSSAVGEASGQVAQGPASFSPPAPKVEVR